MVPAVIFVLLTVGPIVGFVIFVKGVNWFFNWYTDASTSRDITTVQKKREWDTLLGRK